jgi:hypothetical protein
MKLENSIDKGANAIDAALNDANDLENICDWTSVVGQRSQH